MLSRRHPSRPSRPDAPSRREHGQALVIFAISLVAVISVAGLLIDGGMAWANRRMAQSGADTAALAGAKVYSTTADEAGAQAAAENIAWVNGYATNYNDCGGQARTDGVEVNIPPTTGDRVGDASYIEVFVRRPMRTSFSGLVGQPCWMVSARAVAVASSNEVASCNFCSLNNSNQNHTLILKNGSALRVDGDIHANSHNGGYTPGVCTPLTGHKVCGDGFDVFGEGGYISAKHITVVGGWETHDDNIVIADELAPGCGEHPRPPDQLEESKVCIHMPELADPLNDPANPGSVVAAPAAGSQPVPGVGGCPSGAFPPAGSAASAAQTRITSGKRTLCPGTYYGGVLITGGEVTMLAGTYLMIGGGFQILNSGSVDGRAGVMIYTTGSVGTGHSTTQGQSLVPVPVATKLTLKKAELSTSDSSISVGESVTFTLDLEPSNNSQPRPTGYVDFYDGNVIFCSASPLIPDGPTSNKVTATCTTSYAMWGVRSISAVYSGDTTWNAAGDAISQTVEAPSGVKDGPITIETTGEVDLYGPTSGPYAGITIFQDRASNLTVTLIPGKSNAGNCPGNFMRKGVPPDTSPPPDACGDIGGLQGTVYAAHQNALVLIEASGMANLQIIAGEIQVSSDAEARFGFKPSVFASSSIRLVE